MQAHIECSSQQAQGSSIEGHSYSEEPLIPNYLVTVVCDTSINEVIRVAAATPGEACETATKYADSRPFRGPTEILIWRSSIETIQDDDYQLLDLPVQYASRDSRVEMLEDMLREVSAAADAGGNLGVQLVDRLKKLLDKSVSGSK